MPVSISLLGLARGFQRGVKPDKSSGLLDVELDEFFDPYDALSGSSEASLLATSMTPGRADIDAGLLGDSSFSRASHAAAIGFAQKGSGWGGMIGPTDSRGRTTPLGVLGAKERADLRSLPLSPPWNLRDWKWDKDKDAYEPPRKGPVSKFESAEALIERQEVREGTRSIKQGGAGDMSGHDRPKSLKPIPFSSDTGRNVPSQKAWGHTSIDGDLKVLMPGKSWRSASRIHPFEHETLKKRWPRSGMGTSWEDLWNRHQFGLPTKAQRRGL